MWKNQTNSRSFEQNLSRTRVVNVQQKDLHGQEQITREHVDNNAAVRNMLLQRGIVPEQLPPGEDVKKVERRLKSEEKSLTKKQSTNRTSKKGKE